MTTRNDIRRTSHRLVVAATTCAPAVRMVVVVVGQSGGGDDPSRQWFCIDPVLALRTTIRDEYSKCHRIGQDPAVYPDHAGMVDAGWIYECRDVSTEALILGEWGIESATEYHDGTSNTVWEMHAAPWPAEQDEERLAEVIARMKVDVAEKCAARARGRA